MRGEGRMETHGQAVARPKQRTTIFTDPRWEDRFDALIRVTPRTSLIADLLGLTGMRPSRLKSLIDQRAKELGLDPIARPRGVATSYHNGKFLASRAERFEASLLLALHWGPRGPADSASPPELNLGAALDHKLQVYAQFRAAASAPGAPPRMSFEAYVCLVDGVRAGAVEVRRCRCCGSNHPIAATTIGEVPCPVCATLGLHRQKFTAGAAELQVSSGGRRRPHKAANG